MSPCWEQPDRCRLRFSFWRRRTRSNWKGRILFPKPSSIGFSFGSSSRRPIAIRSNGSSARGGEASLPSRAGRCRPRNCGAFSRSWTACFCPGLCRAISPGWLPARIRRRRGNPLVSQYVAYGLRRARPSPSPSRLARRPLLAGRPTVGFADVKQVAGPVLDHRLILNYKVFHVGGGERLLFEPVAGGGGALSNAGGGRKLASLPVSDEDEFGTCACAETMTKNVKTPGRNGI